MKTGNYRRGDGRIVKGAVLKVLLAKKENGQIFTYAQVLNADGDEVERINGPQCPYQSGDIYALGYNTFAFDERTKEMEPDEKGSHTAPPQWMVDWFAGKRPAVEIPEQPGYFRRVANAVLNK